MLKRHCSSVLDLLPHDVVELILEMLHVKPLLRFKCVSSQWKSTIESQRFQERQLIRRMQSRPDVIFVSLDGEEALREFEFGSSIFYTVRASACGTAVCYGSCDGLVCLYSTFSSSFVVNPATYWRQRFPLCGFQQIRINIYEKNDFDVPNHKLGFGKDKVSGTYKPVWLYNSFEFGLNDVTTCEVFDFSTKAWRYLVPASPCRVLSYHKPVYLDGSLYWFTAGEETKILSLDLHTELNITRSQ